MNKITRISPLSLLLAFALLGSSSFSALAADSPTPKRKLLVKAQAITLPEFKLAGVTLEQAVCDLRDASKRYDPDHKGFNFIVTDIAKAKGKITLKLKNVTLAEATERLAESAGLSVSAEDYAFIFQAKAAKP